MKNTIALTLLFFALIANAQKRTAYVLIKEIKGNSWSCPSQQTEYKVHYLSSKMNYEKKQKVLNVFINRFKGSNEKVEIKKYEVRMEKNDYLVFYEYTYQYSKTKYSNCSSDKRRIIKGFPISSIEGIEQKLTDKINSNIYRDKYLSHKILEIKQPFISKEANYLKQFENYLREKLPKGKPKKNGSIGVRG